LPERGAIDAGYIATPESPGEGATINCEGVKFALPAVASDLHYLRFAYSPVWYDAEVVSGVADTCPLPDGSKWSIYIPEKVNF
jgi:hypothetical protein